MVGAASSGGRIMDGDSGMLLAEIISEEGARPTKRQELLAPRPQQVGNDMQGAARKARRGTTTSQ